MNCNQWYCCVLVCNESSRSNCTLLQSVHHPYFPSPPFRPPALSSVVPASVFLLLSLDISPVLQRFIEMAITCKLIAHQLFLQDMDQHANAWSRCLNSCLLTLATATLAIQKMGEQSVKNEVLNSKEGATYFSGMREFAMSSKLTYKLLQSEPGYKNQLDWRNCWVIANPVVLFWIF